MANWYMTYFETRDKEIVELIENGQTIQFYYDEEEGNGHCDLRWGVAALDIEAIENTAMTNKSSFFIRSSDSLTGNVQTWVYENGECKSWENKYVEIEYVDVDVDEFLEME